MGAIVMLTDAVCMGMLALSAGMFRWSTTADRIDIVVMVTQQLCVAVLVVPLYMDTLLSLRGAIRNRKPRLKTRESASQRAEREFINRRALRLWGKTWFRMVGSNLFACLRDTREGIRDPTGSRRQARLRAGQIGPYPEWSFKLRAPVPIDLPRRNSGAFDWYGGNHDNADAITDQRVSDRSWRWKRGPVESDHPLRRSSYSFHSTIPAVGMEAAGQTSSPWNADNYGSDERNGSDGSGPIEDSLSLRQANILIPSAVVVDRQDDAGPLAVRDCTSHLHSGSAKRRDGSHGRQNRAGLIQDDDLPRRRIRLPGTSEVLDDAVHEQVTGDKEANLKSDANVQGPRHRRGHRLSEPTEEDFPRRRSSFWSVSGVSVDYVDNMNVQSVPEHNNDPEYCCDAHGPQYGQQHARKGLVEDSLPRRRSCSSFPIKSVNNTDETDRQPLPEHESDMEPVVNEDGSQHGWGHRRGGILEDDLPHRRPGYSATLGSAPNLAEDPSSRAMHNLDTNMWPASDQHSAWSDRTHKWGEPVEDDVPRRRSVFSSASTTSGDSIYGPGRPSVPKQVSESDMDQTLRQRGRSRPRGGPLENDLPHRRPSLSFSSSCAGDLAKYGLQAVQEHGGDASTIDTNRSRQGERAKRGEPAEDDLPRRRSVFLSSTTSVDSANEQLLRPMPEQGNHKRSSADWAGRQRAQGRARKGLAEDDAPRRRSWFSFSDVAPDGVKAPDVQAGHEQHDGELSVVTDHPREDQGRVRGGVVEDVLPHRRSGFSSASGYSTEHVDVPDLQTTHDHKSILGAVSDDHGQRHGRSGNRGALIKDELPHRRLTYDSGMGARRDRGDTSDVPVTTDHAGDPSGDSAALGNRGRWGWNGRRPIQDHIPHRRPGVSESSVVGVDDSGLALTPEHDYDREPISDSFGGIDVREGRPTGTGRKASGDVDRSLEPSRTDESPGLFGMPWGFSWGKPVATDLPRRNSRNSSDSTHRMGLASKGSSRQDGSFSTRRYSSEFNSFGNAGANPEGKKTSEEGDRSSEPSDMDESTDLFGRTWGFPRQKPVAVDIPRRYSGNLFHSTDGMGLTAYALSRRDGDFSTKMDARKLGSRGDIASNAVDSLGSSARSSSARPTTRPTFLRWAHAEHKPSEIDIPRRRGSQFSISEDGGGG
ncbi:unnamed protein product, partial [Ectocarpus fasciculatus]